MAISPGDAAPAPGRAAVAAAAAVAAVAVVGVGVVTWGCKTGGGEWPEADARWQQQFRRPGASERP